MEFIARHINNEEIFWEWWATDGVADGDIPYGSCDINDVDEYYISHYEELCEFFLRCMVLARKDGGLT